MTNFGFDLNNTPDLTSYDLPDGRYPMIIDKVCKVVFDNGTKIEINNDEDRPDAIIEFRFIVAEGAYENIRFNSLFKVYDEGTAGKIARSTIKSIVEACGVDLTTASFDALQNKIVVLDIKTSVSKTDPEKKYQNIKKVSSISEQVSATEEVKEENVAKKPSWTL